MIICAMLMGGCGRGESGDVVTIRYWNGFTGPDGRTMLALVKGFNDANPDVRIIMQRMEWGTYYNKLFVAGLGGRAPEVFVSHRFALSRFIGAGFVRPADDLFSPGSLDAADFDENILSAVEMHGHRWAVPLDVHPVGMYYNRAMFRAAGIAHPPTNRAEFVEALRKLRRAGTRDLPEQWGFVFTWLRTNVYTLIRQNGGSLFDPTLSHPQFASAANAEALAWGASLVQQNLIPNPQNFDSWIGFRQGRVGMVFEGIYMLPELVRQKDLDWAAAPLPVLFEKPAAWADSHNLVIRKDLEGRKLDAAKRFVRFLSDNSLEWAAGGQVPVRKSLRANPRFAAMHAQSEFAKQIPYVQYLPPTPFVFEYLQEFDLAVELALRGTLPAEEALANAQKKVQTIVDRYAKQTWWASAGGGK